MSPTEPAEVWRPVLGQEGRYEVSDRGRVRSLRFSAGQYDRPRTEPLVLRMPPTQGGYVRVTIAQRDCYVHRLVLAAFAGPCPDGHEGAHLNGKPDDNRRENLCWKTHAENLEHKRLHGTDDRGDRHYTRRHPEMAARGERNGQAVLTNDQVRTIRAARVQGERVMVLAARFGVSTYTIANVIHGRSWSHLPQEMTS